MGRYGASARGNRVSRNNGHRLPFAPTGKQLLDLYQGMLEAYGPQQWWPAESAFEVAVGAVLAQNTSWKNVERAIANLRTADALNLPAMLRIPSAELTRLIRPAGYYNLKAKRLMALCDFLREAGGLEGLGQQSLADARCGLLSVWGVGPETADDILLYALDYPVFVIDTYTRRLLVRHGLAQGGEDYEVLRQGFERALPPDVDLFRQYHALIVEHAKAACRKTPLCEGCCLITGCAQALAE